MQRPHYICKHVLGASDMQVGRLQSYWVATSSETQQAALEVAVYLSWPVTFLAASLAPSMRLSTPSSAPSFTLPPTCWPARSTVRRLAATIAGSKRTGRVRQEPRAGSRRTGRVRQEPRAGSKRTGRVRQEPRAGSNAHQVCQSRVPYNPRGGNSRSRASDRRRVVAPASRDQGVDIFGIPNNIVPELCANSPLVTTCFHPVVEACFHPLERACFPPRVASCRVH